MVRIHATEILASVCASCSNILTHMRLTEAAEIPAHADRDRL